MADQVGGLFPRVPLRRKKTTVVSRGPSHSTGMNGMSCCQEGDDDAGSDECGAE
jgi:hypothetical protein